MDEMEDDDLALVFDGAGVSVCEVADETCHMLVVGIESVDAGNERSREILLTVPAAKALLVDLRDAIDFATKKGSGL